MILRGGDLPCGAWVKARYDHRGRCKPFGAKVFCLMINGCKYLLDDQDRHMVVLDGVKYKVVFR